MRVTVRPVRPRDAVHWLALRCALWPEGSRAEHQAEIERFLAGKARVPEAVLLAQDQVEHIVGFVELSIRPCAEGCTSDRVAYLEGWYVIPQARRQGVGRALVAAAEQWGREQRCVEFASDTQASNVAGTAAHRAVGFAEVGPIRCFRKELGVRPKAPHTID